MIQCRLCIEIFEESKIGDDVHNIFDNADLTNMIHDVLSFEILPYEFAPSLICSYCAETIINFSIYKRTCIDNQKVFNPVVNNEKHVTKIKNEIDIKLEDTGDNDVNISDSAIEYYGNDTVEVLLSDEKNALPENLVDKSETIEDDSDKKTSDSAPSEDPFEKEEKIAHEDPLALTKADKCKTSKGKKSEVPVGNKPLKKKKFKSVVQLEDKNKEYRCEFCEKIIIGMRNFKRHQHTCILPNTKAQCNKCDKVFRHKHLLKTHIKIVHHRSVSDYCHVCGQGFSTKGSLKSHLTVHSPVFFTCDLCNGQYRGLKNLEDHKKLVHYKEKNHQCQVCGMMFTRTDTLKRHSATHVDFKPFKCEYCIQCFKHKRDLKRHFSVHTGTTPYSCGYCGKQTRLKENMYHHIKQKHKADRHLPKHLEIIEKKSNEESVKIPYINRVVATLQNLSN